MNFVGRLKNILKIRKINQKMLADLTGLKPSAVSHFVNGRRKPSFNNLSKLADALCVNIDYLLGRTLEIKACGLYMNNIIKVLNKISESDLLFLADMADNFALKNNQ
jgi:transcriptional regulator with XRE-family HTH domain